jgi:hypothetical protein
VRCIVDMLLISTLVAAAGFHAGQLPPIAHVVSHPVTRSMREPRMDVGKRTVILDSDPVMRPASLDELPLPNVGAASTASRASPQSCGVESTSRVRGSDQGCVWVEDDETVSVQLRLEGLRGQPAQCLAVHLQTSRDAQWRGQGTATVTAFGRIVWSCVLRGPIVVDASSTYASDGEHMLPELHFAVRKLPGAQRWGGFIDEIEFNTLM